MYLKMMYNSIGDDMEYIEEYLTYLKIDKKYSENTIESYKDNLEKLLLLNKDIKTLTKEDLENFLNIQ